MQTLVNFRIENSIKEQFDALCEELGLNISSALNIFIRKMIKEKRIPFDVSLKSDKDIDNDILEDRVKAAFYNVREQAKKRPYELSMDDIDGKIEKIRKRKHAV